ncbi:MAG: hypothetical protein K2J82_06315 [Muribaculaceae bacterium]|nr:hypothetical protein [Muribaculaceae bacterium]
MRFSVDVPVGVGVAIEDGVNLIVGVAFDVVGIGAGVFVVVVVVVHNVFIF